MVILVFLQAKGLTLVKWHYTYLNIMVNHVIKSLSYAAIFTKCYLSGIITSFMMQSVLLIVSKHCSENSLELDSLQNNKKNLTGLLFIKLTKILNYT